MRFSRARLTVFGVATGLLAALLLTACDPPVEVSPSDTQWTETEGAEPEGKPKAIVFKNVATEVLKFKIKLAPQTTKAMFQVNSKNECKENTELIKGQECVAWVNINQTIKPFEKPIYGKLVIEGEVVEGAQKGQKGKAQATLRTR